MKVVRCHLSAREIPKEWAISVGELPERLFKVIHHEIPDLQADQYLSPEVLMLFLHRYWNDHENVNLTAPTSPAVMEKESVGGRLADRVAEFGGSWTFIGIFATILIVWMLINGWWLSNKGFDPYPFILLNLVLSCLAAIQAPVIMMSQNRQEDRDRLRANKKLDNFIILQKKGFDKKVE
jgi:hypothetical protein